MIIRWVNYKQGLWSGVSITGSAPYSVPTTPSEWNAVLAATAVPEGSAFGVVNSYDGTAITAGLFQYTLTSERLQMLLLAIREAIPDLWWATVGSAFTHLGLRLDDNGVLRRGTVKLTRDDLRATFTPPDGHVPKTGKNWDEAVFVAKAFNLLFANKKTWAIQEEYFQEDLRQEYGYKRPNLNGKTTMDCLYPDGWPDSDAPVDDLTVAHALFTSMWQNSPRYAEKYLYAIWTAYKPTDDPKKFTLKLAQKYAYSQYANWGIMKAAKCPKCGYQNAAGRTKCKECEGSLRISRYTKIARTVNKVLGTGTLAEVP